MRKTTLLLIALVPALALAEKIEITRAQAFELVDALASIEPGLAPANAIVVADDINELRPLAEAYGKAMAAAQRQMKGVKGVEVQSGRLTPTTPEGEAAFATIDENFQKVVSEPLKIDLTRLDLSNDEIAASKIRPRTLATIRQFLRPKK